jgi:DNA-binding MarR family transcriptional regulator
MFEVLRLPSPGNVSQSLSRLRDAGHVVRRRDGNAWSLTPAGHEELSNLFEDFDVSTIEAEIALVGGAELQQTQQPLIPPQLAPVRWAVPIRRLLDEFQFETNVFCMTRFPKDEREAELPDPVQAVIEAARESLRSRGLHLHLASDRAADDELFGNIAAHMWACKYGIGLFETRFGTEFNDNLQIEVGAMLMTGRRVALLKDRDTPDMPTDFVGQIYKSVDFDHPESVTDELKRWITDDLGIKD